MRADPCPHDGVALALTDSAILFVDAHGPDVFVAPEFLEAQGRMPGILLEQPAGPASRLTGDGIEAGTAVQPRSREMLRRSAPALGRTPTERFLGPEGRWKLASYEVAGTVGWLVILSRRDNGHFPRPFRTNCLANVFQPPCGWLISGVAPRRAVRDRGFAAAESEEFLVNGKRSWFSHALNDAKRLLEESSCSFLLRLGVARNAQ